MAELGLVVGSRLTAATNLQQGNVFILDARTIVVEKVVEIERFRKTESGQLEKRYMRWLNLPQGEILSIVSVRLCEKLLCGSWEGGVTGRLL